MSNNMALADPEAGELDDMIDTGRYRLSGAGALDVARDVHEQLEASGSAVIPGFVRPEAIASIEAELDRAARHIEIQATSRNVYSKLVPGVADVEDTWLAGHVTRDMIPPYSPAHRLYVSPDFKRFVAACTGDKRVFEYADPLAGLIATVIPPGGKYGWHYDTNEIVVTLAVRSAEFGGEFEFCPNLRKPGDENIDGPRRVIAGEADDLIRIAKTQPGDLQVFRGRYSLHRVAPVLGAHSRLSLVLSYASEPGVIGPLERTRRVYGRVTEMHLVAAAHERGTDGLIL